MRSRSAAFAALAVGVAAAALPAAAGNGRGVSLAGCAGTPKVVVHHAGGRVIAHPAGTPPLACGTSTGYPGAESHIVVRSNGDVVYTPAVLPSGLLGTGTAPVDENAQTQSNASPAAVAVTSDQGAHWRVVKPFGMTWNPTDHSEYVDPATGRLFYEDYGPIPLAPALGPQQEGPAHITWTDDLAHWHHTVVSGLTLPENPRFTSGLAPRGQPRPVGYPDVLYFCANTNVGFTSPVIAGRLCFRSLDGGSTWSARSLLFNGAAPQHPECQHTLEQYSAIDGNYPVPAPNGWLYVMVTCGGTTYLARSTDEAGSFPIEHAQTGPITLPVPPRGAGIGGTPELRITSDGTFILGYADGNHLLVRVSRTQGLSWSRAFDATAPGVAAIKQWAFAASPRGDVAFAYLGQRRGQTGYDGYLTDARALPRAAYLPAGPVFFSGRVNPPGRPLLFGNGIQGSGYMTLPGGFHLLYPGVFNNQTTGNDFIGATIAPDGTPWGSFTQDCGPAPSSPGCVRQHDQTRGFAGRLSFRR